MPKAEISMIPTLGGGGPNRFPKVSTRPAALRKVYSFFARPPQAVLARSRRIWHTHSSIYRSKQKFTHYIWGSHVRRAEKSQPHDPGRARPGGRARHVESHRVHRRRFVAAH